MYGNPYYNQGQRFQPSPNVGQTMPMQQFTQPLQQFNTNIGLLGKVVDSIDVVKAMDIPLDGSISYYPLSDGTAVVSKQLQMDGTSKVVVYKPIQEENKKKIEFATLGELQDVLNDLQDLKDEIKDIKKQFKELKPKKVEKEE